MKTALTIAGSDSSGGAGIQADIKTMTMHGVYAMSAITAMTAQNTTGVRAIQEATPEFLRQQLDAVFEDIRPDAVKIGMVSSAELIRVIADRLRHYGAGNVVVDPVMVASAGSSLIRQDAVQMLIRELLPISTLVTPNIPEAQVLSGMSIIHLYTRKAIHGAECLSIAEGMRLEKQEAVIADMGAVSPMVVKIYIGVIQKEFFIRAIHEKVAVAHSCHMHFCAKKDIESVAGNLFQVSVAIQIILHFFQKGFIIHTEEGIFVKVFCENDRCIAVFYILLYKILVSVCCTAAYGI